MLRNSYWLQKDYLYHKPVIEILLDKKYKQLIDYDFFDMDNLNKIKVLNLLEDLIARIKNYYLSTTYYLKERVINVTSITDTQISKILMGSLGCLPAYDRYLKNGLLKTNIEAKLSKKSFLQLIDFANANKSIIKDKSSELSQLRNTTYSTMKILDMYFWIRGME